MANWSFNPNDVKEINFEQAPVGNIRVRIVDMKEEKSQAGNDMWKFTFKPSGGYSNVFWYLVFDASNPSMTNTNLSKLWNSFGLPGVPTTAVTPQFFINALGAVRIKHELYQGETKAKVHYLIDRDKQIDVPQWQESQAVQSVTGVPGVDIFNDDGPQF